MWISQRTPQLATTPLNDNAIVPPDALTTEPQPCNPITYSHILSTCTALYQPWATSSPTFPRCCASRQGPRWRSPARTVAVWWTSAASACPGCALARPPGGCRGGTFSTGTALIAGWCPASKPVRFVGFMWPTRTGIRWRRSTPAVKHSPTTWWSGSPPCLSPVSEFWG